MDETKSEWIPVNVPQSNHQRIIVDPDSVSPQHALRRRHQIERDGAAEAIETAKTEEERQRAREAFEALRECQHRELEALRAHLTPPKTG